LAHACGIAILADACGIAILAPIHNDRQTHDMLALVSLALCVPCLACSVSSCSHSLYLALAGPPSSQTHFERNVFFSDKDCTDSDFDKIVFF